MPPPLPHLNEVDADDARLEPQAAAMLRAQLDKYWAYKAAGEPVKARAAGMVILLGWAAITRPELPPESFDSGLMGL